MACVRKRRGKYVVDYRDAGGVRRWITADTLTEANGILADKIKEVQAGVVADSKVTIRDYAARWTTRIKPRVRPGTFRHHLWALEKHILPAIGDHRLARVTRPVLRAFFSSKRLKPATIKGIIAVTHTLLADAVEDQLISSNPCTRIGRRLNFGQKNEEVKAFMPDQLNLFLSSVEPLFFPFWLCMSRTGVRIGEACGLWLDDLDLTARTLKIERTMSPWGELFPTKTGLIRYVDVNTRLAGVLKGMIAERRQDYFSRGLPLPTFLFVDALGEGLRPNSLQKQFRKLIARLGLPPQLTPHSLRHTYASMLLSKGENPVYVQRQLGHTSIKMTVDVYGKWMPIGDASAVDKLEVGS